MEIKDALKKNMCFLAPTGALEVGMSDLCLSICPSVCLSIFMLRRALEEFLKYSKELRGVPWQERAHERAQERA